MADLNLNDDGLAIFSAGLLQWVSNHTDERKALSEFGEEINEGSLEVEDFDFHYIPADEMQDWEGASAEHYPDLS